MSDFLPCAVCGFACEGERLDSSGSCPACVAETETPTCVDCGKPLPEDFDGNACSECFDTLDPMAAGGKPKNEPTDSVRFPRQCHTCGQGIEAGYLFGDECYCNECSFASDADFVKWLEGYTEESEEFYTEWPLEEGEEWFSVEGESSESILPESTCPHCRGSLVWEDGDGVETENWACERKGCDRDWLIRIEVVRDWQGIESINS